MGQRYADWRRDHTGNGEIAPHLWRTNRRGRLSAVGSRMPNRYRVQRFATGKHDDGVACAARGWSAGTADLLIAIV